MQQGLKCTALSFFLQLAFIYSHRKEQRTQETESNLISASVSGRKDYKFKPNRGNSIMFAWINPCQKPQTQTPLLIFCSKSACEFFRLKMHVVKRHIFCPASVLICEAAGLLMHCLLI